MRNTQLVRSLGEQTAEELLSDLRVTETMFERMRGLLGREPLNENQGFWIEPCNAIHMWFMHYPLDIVFIDRKKRVCHLVEALRPWGCSASFRAAAVLELQAGQIQRKNIQIGDKLQWQDG